MFQGRLKGNIFDYYFPNGFSHAFTPKYTLTHCNDKSDHHISSGRFAPRLRRTHGLGAPVAFVSSMRRLRHWQSIGSQSAANVQRHEQPAKGRRAVTATTSPTVLIQKTGSAGRPTWRRRDCLPFERVDIREVAVKLLARCDPVWERPLWQDPRSLREGRLAVALSRTSLPLPLPHARWPRAGCAPRGRESLPRSGPGPARAIRALSQRTATAVTCVLPLSR